MERGEALNADKVKELRAGRAVVGDGRRRRGFAKSVVHDVRHIQQQLLSPGFALPVGYTLGDPQHTAETVRELLFSVLP